MRIMVTGGAGFIGSSLVRYLMRQEGFEVFVLDKLTYAANIKSLEEVKSYAGFYFEKVDIADSEAVTRVLSSFKPQIIVHLAAETHVDNSIKSAENFIQTNILGTYKLLESVLPYFRNLTTSEQDKFRFHHVSTDEVFGSLGENGLFDENTNYNPKSPYSASKASSDHLVRAWSNTYGLPTIITNCSNNYGPFQHEEKLIPRMIINALKGKKLPIYGQGQQVRDWLFVDDHAHALFQIFSNGLMNRTYCIGGNNEHRNIDVVKFICNILDVKRPKNDGRSYSEQISFVDDRPGHDYRYAIDNRRVVNELGWSPVETFETGLEKTIDWYLIHYETK